MGGMVIYIIIAVGQWNVKCLRKSLYCKPPHTRVTGYSSVSLVKYRFSSGGNNCHQNNKLYQFNVFVLFIANKCNFIFIYVLYKVLMVNKTPNYSNIFLDC